MGRSSKGIEHVVSVPTFGPKRRTILATHQGMVSLGTPLPEGGWAYAMVLPDGRTATAEAEFRDEAVVECCEAAGVDPVRVLGRAGVERARARRAAADA
jgi:hypothetical protein